MKTTRLTSLFLVFVAVLLAGCTLGAGGNPTTSNTATNCKAGNGTSLKTATELLYEDLQTCDGVKVEGGKTVMVQYKSWVKDGSDQRPLKNTYDAQKPVTFKVGGGQVIRGLDEGVLGMTVGAKRRLILTPALGYGPAGNSSEGVPPNVTLVYEVEILEIRQ